MIICYQVKQHFPIERIGRITDEEVFFGYMRHISLFLASHLTNFFCLSFQLCTSLFLNLSPPSSLQCFISLHLSVLPTYTAAVQSHIQIHDHICLSSHYRSSLPKLSEHMSPSLAGSSLFPSATNPFQ